MATLRQFGTVSQRGPLVLFTFCVVQVFLFGGCGFAPSASPSSVPSASPTQTCATPQAASTLYTLIGYPTPGKGLTRTTLEALDAQHGCLLWKASQTGQTLYALGQGIVYVVTSTPYVGPTTPQTSTISAYEAHTGALRWKVQQPAPGGIISTPEGVLFVKTSRQTNGHLLFTYIALGAADGKVRWTYQSLLPLVVFGMMGYLYGLGSFPNQSSPNAVISLDLATGVERWQVSQPTTPLWLVADSRAVYLGEEDNRGTIDTLVALSAQDGRPLWKFQTPGSMSPPASAGSTLYLTTNTTPSANATSKGILFALNAADGAQRWSVATDMLFNLIIADQTLFSCLGGAQHGVLALTLSDRSVRWKVVTHLSATTLQVANGLVAVGLSGQFQGGPGTDSIEALSASDGSNLWTIQTGGIIQEGLGLA